jgi:hypothetical protein
MDSFRILEVLASQGLTEPGMVRQGMARNKYPQSNSHKLVQLWHGKTRQGLAG